MLDWNAAQYLKFQQQRTQPAKDLAARLACMAPHQVLDVGCGPGNSTAVLAETFPQAEIMGVDNSQNMIAKAQATHPALSFRQADITTQLETLGMFDVIFSNACLQWVPDHPTLIPHLMEHLHPGGVLAVQMPMNGEEPLYSIIDGLVHEPRWGLDTGDTSTNETLAPEQYFDLLSTCAKEFEMWEAVYYHEMPTLQAMVEWVKSTRLKPYLDRLDASTAAALEKELLTRAADVYVKQQKGAYILKFRRFFFVAAR